VTIEDLQRRIAELEASQAALREEILGQKGGGAQPGAKDGPKKESMWSSVGAQLYGYIKLDAAWDSSRIDQGDFARWVIADAQGGDDSQFNITANQTRLGLKLYGPKIEDVTTGGLVEMDFYGGGGENRANPMMRKAYLTIAWQKLDLRLLAGQESDIVSPLLPETVNYTVQWWAGNIGYRRPQVRVSKGYAIAEGTRLDLTLGVTRTIGDASFYSPGDTGEDAGFPTTAGRIALSFPCFTSKATELGVSGHWGEEEYDIDNTNRDDHFNSWSVNLDLLLPIVEKLSLKAEGFFGDNLDAYLGGIGQGVVIDDPTGPEYNGGKEVRGYGGWLAAGIGPFGGLRFNLGASAEYLDGTFLPDGSRTINATVFGNGFYRFYENIELALEIAYWKTEYKSQDDGHAARVQSALIFHF
jgi:hypothetical protein